MKILVVHRQEKVTLQIKSALDNNAIIRYANSGLDGLLAPGSKHLILSSAAPICLWLPDLNLYAR